MPLPFRSSILLALAWLTVALHLAGLGFLAVGIQPGSRLVTLAARRAYVASSPAGWSLGWATWMLCAIALIANFAALSEALVERRWLGRLAVTLAAAGGAIDLFCDCLYIGVLPRLGAISRSTDALFVAVERMAFDGGLVVANGMYTIGVLLLSLALPRTATLNRARSLGYCVFICGMVLVLAGLIDSPWLAALATLPTIGLYCLWTLAVALGLEQNEAAP